MGFHLDFSTAPPEALRGEYPQPGDIYRKAGGPPGFWWIVSVCQNGDAYAFALDTEGRITGANRYGASYFERNYSRRVGHAELPSITVTLEAAI